MMWQPSYIAHTKAAHRSATLTAQTVPESASSQGVLYFWNLEHKDGVDEPAVTVL
jgi:hypothetical protein